MKMRVVPFVVSSSKNDIYFCTNVLEVGSTRLETCLVEVLPGTLEKDIVEKLNKMFEVGLGPMQTGFKVMKVVAAGIPCMSYRRAFQYGFEKGYGIGFSDGWEGGYKDGIFDS